MSVNGEIGRKKRACQLNSVIGASMRFGNVLTARSIEAGTFSGLIRIYSVIFGLRIILMNLILMQDHDIPPN